MFAPDKSAVSPVPYFENAEFRYTFVYQRVSGSTVDKLHWRVGDDSPHRPIGAAPLLPRS